MSDAILFVYRALSMHRFAPSSYVLLRTGLGGRLLHMHDSAIIRTSRKDSATTSAYDCIAERRTVTLYKARVIEQAVESPPLPNSAPPFNIMHRLRICMPCHGQGDLLLLKWIVPIRYGYQDLAPQGDR
jgi:hypothetical protein